MDAQQTRNILEACLLVAGKPMNIGQLDALFEADIDRPDRNAIKAALSELQAEYEGRGIELVEVASGWRLQSRASMEHWVGRLFQEKNPRYSRALLETLVLIAYRQPITRGEIEEVRGVAVSSNIIKTLQERDWVKEIGYKDVPGKPALWGTTRQFLDYFNLKRLDELPTLAEARELEEIDKALSAEEALVDGVSESVAANDDTAEGETSGEANADSAEGESAGEENLENAEGEGADEANVETVEGEASSESNSENTEDENSGASSLENSESRSSQIEEIDSANAAETVHAENSEPGADSDNATADTAEGAETNADLGASSAVDNSAGDTAAELVAMASVLPDDAKPTGDFSALVSSFVERESALVDADDETVVKDELSEALEEPQVSDKGADTPAVEANAADMSESDGTEESTQGDEETGAANRVVEAEELSAHDVVIEKWPEPSVATDSKDSDSPGSDDKGDVQAAQDDHGESAEGDAQAKLLRAIDDFADEHQQELDARDELEGHVHSSDQQAAENRVGLINEGSSEPEYATASSSSGTSAVIAGAAASLFGLSGPVASELAPFRSDTQEGSEPEELAESTSALETESSGTLLKDGNTPEISQADTLGDEFDPDDLMSLADDVSDQQHPDSKNSEP